MSRSFAHVANVTSRRNQQKARFTARWAHRPETRAGMAKSDEFVQVLLAKKDLPRAA
jgi:hypothetical protein